MPGERDGSSSTHDAGGPSLAPVTEEAASQANPGTQYPSPAVPRVDNAAPPSILPSNPGPSSAAPMPVQGQTAAATSIGGHSSSAPTRPPRNPERAQSVAARDAGEPLVAPNTGEGSAQANPEPQPPSPTPTRIEYPTSPPLVTASPSPSPEASESASAAPQPAIFDVLRLLSYIADTLFTISGQLDANNNILVERINVTSGHSYRILGDIVQATQRRGGRSATLSSSYEAPSGASGALPPEPPEVVSGIPAGRAETPQPELIADSEQSPYVPTELDTPHDDVPASLSIDIVEEDNELLPVDLGGGGDAHAAEAATAPAQALDPMNGPLDESEVREYATGIHEDAATLANAAGVLSQPDQVVGADVGQADGSQEPAAPFEALPSASDVASLSDDDSERSVMEPTAAPDEGPIDTLVSCRSTNEFCPGTLQLIVDVGTNGVVRTGDKLFFLGDFDEAINRLPSICTARDTQWSKLHLRIAAGSSIA
uniref:Uncharacterized protein n=1 Tax=Schizophyllum commune (strain H4-8 / FGSC 9210) TaxID=578458 RepID=D8QKZ5_SCHCM